VVSPLPARVDPVGATSGEIAVSLRDLTKRNPGASGLAVADLSLDVASGEIVALVGPSGCGKTTTLKMINRLVEPTAGTIEVLGRDQRSLPVHAPRSCWGPGCRWPWPPWLT
jgi:ABC-type Fe3+/spermidine/putrescine transport system ATPase subunit